ncbi:NAD/NADP octopine/nopaline dehydrogenase family protein [Rhizobiaceae bacterium BDR2-2]|uniref:NAD/NADP octopine/nopaline dehydrogenase family protein n=1 Tax=Ectorhizobium quercum TaxID=2965071 RepID=A0AAE3STA7_9HYPH|nr:NAD/NADP octopine/nopaline dehydrogenase family protein [Ectorhizobium quercum]MCX8995945.1 NAD/NADP octopine/nopaline dehydrogenase family protein [Ectorhizobium quercum]
MRIAIFGAGAVGLSLAAYWLSQGHQAVIVSLSGRGRARFSDRPVLKGSGCVSGQWQIEFLDPHTALEGAELAVIAQQVEGHLAAVDALDAHLGNGQCVLVSGALAFATSLLAERLKGRGIDVPIGATPVPPVNARMTGPCEVLVSRIKETLEVFSAGPHAQGLRRVLQPLLPATALSSLTPLAGADLNNINPIAHYANALCNFTRMEKGESWLTYAGYTEHAGKLIDALDAERQAIAASIGVETRSTYSYFAEWNGMSGGTVPEISKTIVERGLSPLGPASLSTRYVLEDVPYGLVPLEALGRRQGVRTPLISAGIDIFSALYGVDFRRKPTMTPLP